MKSKYLLILIGILATESFAHAQPITWTGPARGGYSEPFSMGAWMYVNMVHVATQIEVDTNGHPTNWGTMINDDGGFSVLYSGENSNRIACSSHQLNTSNGLWLCQFSNGQLTDGPLTRRLVSYFLKSPIGRVPVKVVGGTFVENSIPGQIEYALKYDDGRSEGIRCSYTFTQHVVTEANCSIK